MSALAYVADPVAVGTVVGALAGGVIGDLAVKLLEQIKPLVGL